MLRRALAGIDALGQAAAALAVLLIVGIAVLVITEIFCRAVLNISLSFAWEFSAYFLGISMFCGAAFTLRTGGHVRVAFLTSAWPSAARGVELLATVFGVGISAFVALALVRFAWRSFAQGSTSSTIDATPLVIPQAGLAIGATLLALQFVARLVRLLIREAPDDEAAMQSFNVE